MSSNPASRKGKERQPREPPPLSYQELESYQVRNITSDTAAKADSDSDVIILGPSVKRSLKRMRNRRGGLNSASSSSAARQVVSRRQAAEELPEEFLELLAETYKQSHELLKRPRM